MSNLPFTVYGTITDVDSTNPSNAKVVIRNNRSGESISVFTNSVGQYVGDLANLTSGYVGTDTISVICALGNASNESSFTISGSSEQVNLTLTTISESADVTYCQVQDVLDELGDKNTSDISYERIRKIILRSESEIEERTGTMFKSTSVTDEIYDFNQYNSYLSPDQQGYTTSVQRTDYWNNHFADRFQLEKYPILSITSLYKNLAAKNSSDDWSELTEQSGSGGDFLVDYNTGVITFINNIPNRGSRRIKVSYTYGYNVVPKIVERLCILLSVRDVLSSKANSSQFDSMDNISLEGISITKGIGSGVSYMSTINREIQMLFQQIGEMTDRGQ